MKAANQEVFSRFDAFCASKGVEVKNAGSARWIASEPKHRHFLINSVLIAELTISQSRKIVRIDLVGQSIYMVVGFNTLPPEIAGDETALEPSHMTVLLSEVRLKPRASPYQVKNIIEADDAGKGSSYRGHDLYQIAGLFPEIKVLRRPVLSDQGMWKFMFRIAVEECRESDSWITDGLAETLICISDLDPEKIPYKILCKSIFDSDPTNFFLALYRCLEALYAYSSSTDLIEELSLTMSWSRVAVALEERLGWHPREEGSLERLFRFASALDLKMLIEAITRQPIEVDGDRMVSLATRKVYSLRNGIVHFRPAQHSLELEALDWIKICTAISGAVLDIYDAVQK